MGRRPGIRYRWIVLASTLMATLAITGSCPADTLIYSDSVPVKCQIIQETATSYLVRSENEEQVINKSRIKEVIKDTNGVTLVLKYRHLSNMKRNLLVGCGLGTLWAVFVVVDIVTNPHD